MRYGFAPTSVVVAEPTAKLRVARLIDGTVDPGARMCVRSDKSDPANITNVLSAVFWWDGVPFEVTTEFTKEFMDCVTSNENPELCKVTRF